MKQMKIYVQVESTGFDNADAKMSTMAEKLKEQVIKVLRPIEKEIIEEGGTIVYFLAPTNSVSGGPALKVTGFTGKLKDKIRPLLKSVNYKEIFEV